MKCLFFPRVYTIVLIHISKTIPMVFGMKKKKRKERKTTTSGSVWVRVFGLPHWILISIFKSMIESKIALLIRFSLFTFIRMRFCLWIHGLVEFVRFERSIRKQKCFIENQSKIGFFLGFEQKEKIILQSVIIIFTVNAWTKRFDKRISSIRTCCKSKLKRNKFNFFRVVVTFEFNISDEEGEVEEIVTSHKIKMACILKFYGHLLQWILN